MADAKFAYLFRVTLDDPERMDPPSCYNCGSRYVHTAVEPPGLVIRCQQRQAIESIPDHYLTAGERQWMAENLDQPD